MNPNVRYIARPAAVHTVDDVLSLASLPGGPAPVPVETAAVTLLTLCTASRTLDEHAARIARHRGSTPQTIRQQLETLVAHGLLDVYPPAETRSRQSQEPPPEPIEVVAIPTGGRPRLLSRCLDSYSRHAREQSRHVRFVVADGSTHDDAFRQTADVVADHRRTDATEIALIGPVERARFRTRAAAADIPPDVVDWLLGTQETGGAGAARNLVLLATAGSTVLTVDDDTLCAPWTRNPRGRGVAVVGHVDPRETEFFDSRSGAIASLPGHADLFAAHEAMLGHVIVSLLGAAGEPPDLENNCHHLLPAVWGTGRPWRIRATWSGLAGDAATSCPHLNIFATGATRSRLAADETAFQTALSSREVRRMTPCFTITDEPWLMTYNAGLDNTSLLPPFSPIGAYEDGLFGAMLTAVDPTSRIGQIPVGIVHDSTRPASYGHAHITSATSFRINELVHWMCDAWRDGAMDQPGAARMRALGQHLLNWGGMDADEFRARLTPLVVNARVRLLRACDALLNGAFDYPPFWRAEFRRYQQAVLTGLVAPDAIVPREFRAAPSVDQGLALTRQHLTHMGSALRVWPELWALFHANPL